MGWTAFTPFVQTTLWDMNSQPNMKNVTHSLLKDACLAHLTKGSDKTKRKPPTKGYMSTQHTCRANI